MSYEEIGLLCSRSRSRQNFKMLMNFCPADIFWIAEPFITKLGMVMHHHEPDCLPERLICCLQGQSHSEGSHNKNMTLHYVFWTADPFATELVWWRIIISWIALWKDWSALLWSRSGSQERLHILVNVHLDNINCWTFVTKLGIVMHYHGPESCKKICLLSSSSRSQWRLI